MPTVFLCLALIGALMTANAFVAQRRFTPFVIPSFLAGWLVSELPRHQIAWQAVATVAFVGAGALESWQGWLGLVVTFASWGGLLALLPIARRAADVTEASLREALGADYRAGWSQQSERSMEVPPLANRQLWAFKMRHPDVRVIRNIPYIDDGDPKHMLDLYAPRTPAPGMTPAPVLLQIHGGGWVIGNKREQALPLMNLMAARGWICVAANYRLSPKATFPDHLLDVKRAVKWIREEIQNYGGDPNFIVATGGSAGGHLSSLLTLTANDPAYQPGFENLDTSMNGCVPFYGVYDFTDSYDLQVHPGLMAMVQKTVLKKSLETDRDAFLRASPMHRVHSDTPPMFVIHGDQDGLAPVEEARQFVQLLRESSKSPVAYAEIPGAQHAFDIFHSPRCSIVIEAVARFLVTLHSDSQQHGAGFRRGTRPSAPR
jgi:acetyl esterase/lipase